MAALSLYLTAFKHPSKVWLCSALSGSPHPVLSSATNDHGPLWYYFYCSNTAARVKNSDPAERLAPKQVKICDCYSSWFVFIFPLVSPIVDRC